MILLHPFAGLEGRARLRLIEIDLPLAEVFAGVEFPPEAARAAQDA